MKILVAGATGFIGKQTVMLLRDRGHEVVVLTRDPELAGVRLPIDCKRMAWDPSLGEPPLEAFRGAGAVVNLAGENIAGGLWTASRKREIVESRVLSVRHLVQAMQKLDVKPRVFVSASAVGIYGDRSGETLDEGSPPGNGVLAEVCRDWEREIFRTAALGIRAVALRFGIVLGKDGGALGRMLPPFRLGLGGPLGSGRQWMSWVHVRDAAGLIVHAVEDESLLGAVNAVSPNPATNREFAKTLGGVLRRPALLPVPAFLLRTALGELSSLLLDSQRAVSKKTGGYRFLYPDLRSALGGICAHFNHEYLNEQWVPQPMDRVFPFFSEAKNLEVLTPESMSFKIIRQSGDRMDKGSKIDYGLKLHGIPFRWQTHIIDWQANARFTDHQSKGPYAEWRHIHEFIEKDGGVLLRDRVSYRLPLDMFSDPVAHPFVRKDLEKIFLYRRRKVEELFGKGT
ncbi:MAG: TIGR01777 family protein [Nitrospinae bacterium]|nr:TIGR01777 family protein [Nitrospinota bacterium]